MSDPTADDLDATAAWTESLAGVLGASRVRVDPALLRAGAEAMRERDALRADRDDPIAAHRSRADWPADATVTVSAFSRADSSRWRFVATGESCDTYANASTLTELLAKIDDYIGGALCVVTVDPSTARPDPVALADDERIELLSGFLESVQALGLAFGGSLTTDVEDGMTTLTIHGVICAPGEPDD